MVKRKSEFIDDEAELSGDDEVSEDELELSDDDLDDLDLVDKEAKELDSDEEEEIRGLYHKQLENEDKRAVLLLQEQLEDKDVAIGQQRRRKFRWQTKELMENSLKRHYDPDDEDSQEGEDDDDDAIVEYESLQPKLRRPTGDALLLGPTKLVTGKIDHEQIVPTDSNSNSEGFFKSMTSAKATTSSTTTNPHQFADDSNNSNTFVSRMAASTSSSATGGATKNGLSATSDLNRFLFRDKEVVEALSTRETVIITREEKDRNIQRELKRVLTSKSIFDSLYG